MKKYIIIGLLTLIAVSLWNCEKDDLCPRTIPTTSRVVIEFYDAANPTELKNVTNLKMKEVDSDLAIVANPNALVEADKYLFNTNKVFIPLKTNALESKFNFTLNSGGAELLDVLTFTYNKEDIYISRACGYSTTFEITNSNSIIASSPGNWIQSITVENVIIENENETHVKIYF